MSYHSRLSKAFANAPVLPLNNQSRYVLFSDCHRGDGSGNDNFLKNQHLYFAALQYYYTNGYTYFELGDGDELWENRCMHQITEIHSNVFWLLNQFAASQRLYLLYGNHDIVKRNLRSLTRGCAAASASNCPDFQPDFSNLDFYSGIILADQITQREIYLTHGHQADFLNSAMWRLARFLVRYVWRPVEALGFRDPTSAAKNNTKKIEIERRLTNWAIEQNHILVTGHTHRPMLGSPESPYFNTGSCVHPRCITCIEIRNRCFYLVKWTMTTRPDQTLYVARQLLAGPTCISDYVTGGAALLQS